MRDRHGERFPYCISLSVVEVIVYSIIAIYISKCRANIVRQLISYCNFVQIRN